MLPSILCRSCSYEKDETFVHGCPPPPRGVLPEKLGRGVRPVSQNPYPIYDQNLRFLLPNLWPVQNRDPIYDQNGWKTLSFLAAHTYIAHIREYPRRIVLCPKHSSDHYVPHHCYVLDTLVLDWILIYRKWSIYNPADISDIVYVALFCVRFLTLAPGAKEYIITPIYKSGNKNDITNYNRNLGEFSELIAERHTVRQVRDVSCHVLKIYTSINCCCYCCCCCCCRRS